MSSTPTGGPVSGRSIGLVVNPTISPGLHPRLGAGRFDVLNDAFRPFYLCGAMFAMVAMPLWLGMWYGGSVTPSLPSLFWHAHEMVFGFAAAIIVGFLFTAARNWTGLQLPRGTPLAILVGLWLAARVGMFFAYGPVTAVVDSLLLVLVAGVLARKFAVARRWGSMPLVIVLSLLACVNIAFHTAAHGVISSSPLRIVEAGLLLVVLIEMIIGGRVVPGFSANALPGVWRWHSVRLHRGSLALAGAAFLADSLQAPTSWTGILALLAGALVVVQALGWNPFAARIDPMLWILHAAYAWIPAGLLLLGLASFGIVPRSAAIHALAVGSTGGLILGMITRTALAHSGWVIRAGSAEVLAFVLILLAAVLRVAAALIPGVYMPGMLAAGTAWTLAFLVYLFAYTPLLLGKRPRRPDAPITLGVARSSGAGA